MHSNPLCRTVFIISVALFLCGALISSGFCMRKMRYLSSEERIRLAFDSINSATRLRVKILGKGFEYREFIKYQSFDKYLKNNPDCCAVNPPGGSGDLPPPSVFASMFGYHSGKFVRINYKVRYLDDNGKQRFQRIKVDQAQRNCGEAITYN